MLASLFINTSILSRTYTPLTQPLTFIKYWCTCSCGLGPRGPCTRPPRGPATRRTARRKEAPLSSPSVSHSAVRHPASYYKAELNGSLYIYPRSTHWLIYWFTHWTVHIMLLNPIWRVSPVFGLVKLHVKLKLIHLQFYIYPFSYLLFRIMLLNT